MGSRDTYKDGMRKWLRSSKADNLYVVVRGQLREDSGV